MSNKDSAQENLAPQMLLSLDQASPPTPDKPPPLRSSSVLAVLGFYKLGYLLLIFLSIFLTPLMFNFEQFDANYHFPPNEARNLSSHFKTWDTSHYLRLGAEGYKAGTMSAAFPPLWPLLIRWGHFLTSLSHLSISMILSFFFSLWGGFLFFRLVESEFGRDVAEFSTLFFLAYPGALFFHFPYTESLFLCLVMLFFLSLQKCSYGWVAVWAILAVMTRTVGVFLFFPLLYHFFALYQKQRTLSFRVGFVLASPFVGYVVCMIYMAYATGNFFEAMQAQRKFLGQPSMSKLFDVIGFINASFRITSLHDPLGSGMDRLWFVFFLFFMGWMLYKKLWFYASFALPMGLFPAMLNSYMCYTRYLSVVFPIFIVCGLLLSVEKRRVWRWSLLAVFLMLQQLLLVRHINYHWVG